MLVVPEVFAEVVRRREGVGGARWIQGLPALVEDLVERWQVRVDGPVRHGQVAVVVPVRRADGCPAALKVSWVDQESRHEGAALRWWAGRGAVGVLDAAPERGALLLERLDPLRSLHDVDQAEALTAAAAVLRLLHVPAPPGLPTTSGVAARWGTRLVQRWRAAGTAVGGRAGLLGEVGELCRSLAAPAVGPVLLHGDLHYANVLADLHGTRWSAIDPKPVAGHPEFDLLPLLRNRWEELAATGDPVRACRRRLQHLVDLTGADGQRARQWALARTVDDALWGIEHHEPTFTRIAWTIADALR